MGLGFNAGVIAAVFAAIFAAIYFAGKIGKSEPADVKEPYACGESGAPQSGEDVLYASVYKHFDLKKFDLLHNEDLNEYLSWMLAAVVAAIAVLAVSGA